MARVIGNSQAVRALLLVGGLWLASASALAGEAPVPAGDAGVAVSTAIDKTAARHDRFIIKYRDGSAEQRDAGVRQRSLDAVAVRVQQWIETTRPRRGRSSAAGEDALALRHVRRMSLGADVIATSRKLDAGDGERLLQQLRAQPNVEYVEIDRLLRPALTPNDPKYLDNTQWGLNDADAGIRANTAWDVATGSGITIAIIDTGITAHSDLNANVVAGYDFISDGTAANDGGGRDADPSDPGDWTSGQCGSARGSSWHGTHVAGIAAARTNNGVGGAGVAFDAKIMPVRALGTCGGSTSDIADAVVWSSGGTVPGVATLLAANAAQVINMSLGDTGACSSTLQAAINSAVGRGTTVVVAAGNDGSDAANFSPANCGNVIAVAAMTSSSQLASFSNFGPTVDVAAPGSSIYSTINTGSTLPVAEGYGNLSGTSMAAPHVAGIVALAQSRRLALALPLYTPAEIEAQIKATAYAPAASCICGCGFGLVDARSLVDAAGAQSLANGVVAAGLSATAGNGLRFSLAVPRGSSGLSFATSGGSGNPDVYVKFGSAPTTTDFDCSSTAGGTAETCPIPTSKSGTWHVLVQGTSTFSGVSLTGSYTANAAPLAGFSASSSALTANFTSTASDSDGSIASYDWVFGDGGTATTANPSRSYTYSGAYLVRQAITDNGGATACAVQSVTVVPATGTLANGVAVPSLRANTGGELRYTLAVPSGGSGLSFVTSGANGDADLFVKFGSPPTINDYDCKSDSPTSIERCDIATSAAGTWHVLIRAFANFSALSVTGSYNVSGTPYADFSYASSPMSATFTDASIDTDGSIASRSWNFGDSTSSTATNPTKTWTTPGAYDVTLTVTDNLGNSHAKTRVVPANPTTVALANAVPVAVPTANKDALLRYTFVVPTGATALTFTTSGTAGGGGANDADLFVRFGSEPQVTSYDCSSTSSTPNETCSIVVSQPGTYHVLVHAFNAIAGVTLTASYSPPGFPVANFTFSSSGLTANFTDTSSDSDGTVVSRSWNFGDGATSTATNPSHAYAAPGTYSVQLTATDNSGNSHSVTKAVTVAAPPVFISISDASVNEGDSGTTTATFVVSLSAPAFAPVGFRIATGSGGGGSNATAGTDYQAIDLSGQSIPAGQTSASFDVLVNGDTTVEPNETFAVNLSSITGASITDNTGAGTIVNDDVPVLTIADASVSEGNSGSKNLTFTVSLSQASTSPINFSVATADGTATASSDYGALANVQTITAGNTSKTFNVTINGDTVVEADETFVVNIGSVTGAVLGDGQATGTIVNDDNPALSIADVSVVEGNGGTSTATFTVSLSQLPVVPVVFDIATANVSATAGSDYLALALAGQSIPAGQGSKTFDVTINGDTVVEANETYTVTVSNVTGATISDAIAIGTISNDDLPVLSIADASITEGNSGSQSLAFTVSLDQAGTAPVTFSIATANGTATAGSDYTSLNLSNQNIGIGQTSKTFNVTISGDTAVEPDETFTLAVSGVVGATVGDGSAVGTILNNDLPALSIADVVVTEGNSGSSIATFTVQLSAAAPAPVGFDIATADSSATAGSDYVANALVGQVIAAGQSSATFSVTINGDTAIEATEIFLVNISNVTGATIADGQANGTITNDDLPALTIADASINEGNSGTSTMTFTVSLDQPAPAPVTFSIASSNGTASSGSDYVALSLGGQSIPAGQTSKTFAVTINGDTAVEPDETFTLAVSGVAGATVADGSAIGTITNDDSPVLSIADVSIAEGNSGTSTMTFTISLDRVSITPVLFDIATADVTATAGSDYVAASLVGQSIPAGQTSKTFAVTINGDATVETNETFAVNIGNVSGATVGDGSAVGTITNDDSPQLSIADVSMAEGNSGTSTMTFTISLDRVSITPVLFDIATADVTATAGSDYVAASLVGQSIPAGQTSKTFAVTINGDATVEANETFAVNIGNVSGATVGDGSAVGTITNDDSPVLTIADVSIAEGNSGTSTMTFTVSLDRASIAAVTFDVATANGTATSGSDYVALSLVGQSIPAGQTSKTFAVTINGDTAVEPDETFTLAVSNVAGAIVADGSATGTINNDDSPVLTIADVLIAEGNSGTSTMTFTVSLDRASIAAVTFDVATANGTATSGSDYVALSLVGQSIPAGQTSKTFAVTINGDTTVEPDETFTLAISSVVGATVSDGSAIGTITNDDLPALTIADASINEGNSGTSTMTFTVSLDQPAPAPVTFSIASSNGTASSGSDYVALSLGGQSIPAGQTSKTFAVTINGDTAVEPDETFTLAVSNVAGATVSDGSAIGTITNDDSPVLTIADVSIAEGNSGTSTMTFTVSLAPAGIAPVTFDIATADGTATAGSDYVAKTLTGQSIAAGVTSKTFTVTINGDTSVEPDETFLVNVGNVSGATVSDGSAIGTITNDDSPVLTIADVSIAEGNSGTSTATFTVILDRVAIAPVTFDVATANGTATAGSDFVALALVGQSIPAGQTSKTFAVTINGDTAVEPDETFTLAVSNVAGATVSDGSAIGTITNDDSPVLTISDVSIAEGNNGTSTMTFTVSLAPAGIAPVTFDIATADGTATAGSDYVAKTLTGQSIAAGVTSKTFTVTINGDTSVEPDETFLVNVGNVSGATVSDGSAIGTIINDDSPVLTIADVSIAEGNSGTSTMTFTISLDRVSITPVLFDIATADITATAGSDYVAASLVGQSIPAGQTSKTFAVTINGDATVEANETFAVNIGNVSGATVGDGSAVGTITNDDNPVLTIADVSIAEGNTGTSTMTFTISLDRASIAAVTFDVATANGTATAGSDFVALALVGQSIPAGQTSKTFAVTINGDSAVEPDETFTLSVSNVAGAIVADGSATGTITNDDSPVLSIADVSIAEGNSGTSTMTFTVSLDRASIAAVTFDVATANGTATAGSDYVALSLVGQSIPAGQTSKTFTVTINGDTVVEPDETFTLAVSNVAGATVSDGSALGTISNDDNAQLSIGDVSLSEGNSGTSSATFTVSLDQPTLVPVTFAIATSNGTASAGSDYLSLNLTSQSIPAGQTSKTFNVTIKGDTAVEPDETFTLSVSNVAGAIVADGSATGTINNDDSPALSIADVSVVEGNSGTATMTFTASLDQAGLVQASFDITTVDVSATAGSDYEALALIGQTIPAGQTSKTFSVTINGDTTVEANETFVVNAGNVTGATVADGSATGTITNDDMAALSIADVSVTEGNSGTSVATFTVSLDQASLAPVTFAIATSNGTAAAGSDYLSLNLTNQAIPAGQTSKTFNVTINGDTSIEANETFTVTVSNVVGATVLDGSAIGTILNDDSPSIAIADASLAEGNTGTSTMVFTVSLDRSASTAVTFDIATADGTATAGSDYLAVALAGQSIAAGQTSKTFNVTINGDLAVEPNETFAVAISSVVGATVADGSAIGTITNDDLPALSIADVSVVEGNSGTSTATFTVSLDQPAVAPVTFAIASSNGTAAAGSDYLSLNLTGQSIAAGQSSKNFSVTINGDTSIEADETFVVSVSNVAGATVSDGSATGTIVNDDSLQLSIADVSVVEGNAGAKAASFTISLNAPAPLGGVGFDVATRDLRGTGNAAQAGVDYAAASESGRSIASGQTSASFVVKIIGDTKVEADEMFAVDLSNIIGAAPGRIVATGTISNDDSNTITIADLQGTGDASPWLGQQVRVQGIASARRGGGFFLQSAIGEDDGNAATSEAVFVSTAALANGEVAIGQRIEVLGTVQEAAIGQRMQATRTQLAAIEIHVLATNQSLPLPVRLDAAWLAPSQAGNALERLEGMRVEATDLLVVAPVEGAVDEAHASAMGNGRFHVVARGVARPFREPGALPGQGDGTTLASDGNPERLRVDSAGLLGAQGMAVDAGDRIAMLSGVIDHDDGDYVLLPDAGRLPVVTAGAAPHAAEMPRATEVTMAEFVMGRFYDDRDDPSRNEPVLTADAYALRLAKAANAVCGYLRNPDILALFEVENADTLADLAAAINGRAGNVLFPDTCSRDAGYRMQTVAGGDAGLVSGLLVSTAEIRPGLPRVEVLSLSALSSSSRFDNPDGSHMALHENPPLLLRARINAADGSHLEVSTLAVRFTPAPNDDDATPGTHGWPTLAEQQRARRLAQSRDLAALLERRQRAYPDEKLVLLGALDAPDFDDGRGDILGLLGKRNRHEAGTISRPLRNLADTLPANERYTMIDGGDAQAREHIYANTALVDSGLRLQLDAVRLNADFGVDNYGDFNVPVRSSERDPLLLHIGQP